ncbi:MAG: uracil-DNA glycosylase [Pseudomonadota bacterium]|nr:uracil-DNA glycosylase [Pseudomonadota bacterium]
MSPMSDLHRQVLKDMGIDVWLLRDNVEAAEQVPEVQPDIAVAADDNEDSWNVLQKEVQACQRCALSKSRSQTVFGSGSTQAELLLIGEAPGAEEDRQGLPFVGKAGKLLDAMLLAIGLQRDQVYTCNILKCRPPNNRNPQAAEVAACAPFLSAQIDYIKPKVVLALGRFAAHSLLQTEMPVYKMRENNNILPGTEIPVVVTYHPASLLRNPEQKAQSWQDLCRVTRLLASHAGD